MKTIPFLLVIALLLAACTPAATQVAPPAAAAATAVPTRVVEPTPTEALAETPAEIPAATEQPAEDGTVRFVLVAGESQASYMIDETFINQNNRLFTAVGVTTTLSGELRLNYADPAASQFGEFQVDISKLTSDSSRRDNAIRQNWLESSTYPLAVFTVTGVQNFPNSWQEGQKVNFQLVGDLKIRQTTRQVTWDVTGVLQGDRLAGTATTNIMLVDFDVEPPSIAGILSVTDGALLTLEFVFVKQ
ncbi:MAG TPA: YceI family protein [Anaerolineaceae bacterium]|nr:YceI family protein [Anaerolineaceae bacterium]HPA32717.1 YceI family protein [Anaerolineaceae bacterium]HQO97489.1 YceI family protein [Anaerolineaceae bacterium]HQP61186.1 YceI family protein [Anaerolineaceae bacterium]